MPRRSSLLPRCTHALFAPGERRNRASNQQVVDLLRRLQRTSVFITMDPNRRESVLQSGDRLQCRPSHVGARTQTSSGILNFTTSNAAGSQNDALQVGVHASVLAKLLRPGRLHLCPAERFDHRPVLLSQRSNDLNCEWAVSPDNQTKTLRLPAHTHGSGELR